MFQCRSPSRRAAICARVADLKVKLAQWKTAPLISKAIIAGMEAWLDNKQAPTSDSLLFPDNTMGNMVKFAIAAQTDLGWNVLFRGFFPEDWRKAQEHYRQSLQSKDGSVTSERWIGNILDWIFDLFDLVWGLRNADEHGAEPETQRLIQHAKNERAIRRLYDKSLALPYCERHPFRQPMATLLASSVCDQELWITQTEWFLPRALKRAKKRVESNQRALTEFIPRVAL